MSNELIHELADALEYSSDFIPMWALKCDDVVETLAKARAYLASGGWTRVEDGLPVVPDGLDHVEIFFFCEQDCERRVGRRLWLDVDAALSHGITHWRYVEPTPEPPHPRKDRTMTPDQLPAGLLVKACILTVCVLVAACAESGDIRNVTDYRCNEQQIQNATAQSNACITGGYLRTYCWRTAVHAHCEDMRAKK